MTHYNAFFSERRVLDEWVQAVRSHGDGVDGQVEENLWRLYLMEIRAERAKYNSKWAGYGRNHLHSKLRTIASSQKPTNFLLKIKLDPG